MIQIISVLGKDALANTFSQGGERSVLLVKAIIRSKNRRKNKT